MKIKRQSIRNYLILLLGSAILSFGLFNIHSQSRITEGGVLGATLLIHHWLGISPGIAGFILDMSCYALGLRFLGRQFLKYALVASSGFALFYSLFERIGYLLPDLSGRPLLAALAGALFVGIGVGLVVRIGGAAGGDDALALVLSKLTRRPIAHCYIFTDLVILLLSLSYIPFAKIFYSLISVTISSYIIGLIQGKKPQKAGKKS
jgi:uncharacterized membrane-anchored protein YitT (DUF2179 family)